MLAFSPFYVHFTQHPCLRYEEQDGFLGIMFPVSLWTKVLGNFIEEPDLLHEKLWSSMYDEWNSHQGTCTLASAPACTCFIIGRYTTCCYWSLWLCGVCVPVPVFSVMLQGFYVYPSKAGQLLGCHISRQSKSWELATGYKSLMQSYFINLIDYQLWIMILK